MRYRAIVARVRGTVSAVAFFWVAKNRAVLVDFVGSRQNGALIQEIVGAFVHACRGVTFLECSTTHLELQTTLQKHGFIKWRSVGTIFNVFPATLAGPGHEWFLMGGDSDGDILAAARAGDQFRVERWSEEHFFAARAEWSELLEHSDANRLFLSWEWLSTWWSTYSRRHHLELYCLAVRDKQDRLIGIAPLYLHRAKLRGLFSKRAQFIGNIWQGRATMRTEYLEFIVERARADLVVATLLDTLSAARDWDDIVLTDLDQESATYRVLHRHALGRDNYIRYVSHYTGYAIHTHRTWDAYLREISGNQRRKLFLQRRQLEARGPVELEWFDGNRFEEFADRLDRLHALRWGRPFFKGEMRNFHRHLVSAHGNGALCHASILVVGGRDVSALYNVRAAGREYNLQGGFDEQFARGLSMAFLHLGYVIERAIADKIDRVELLVGGGKKGNFKSSISQPVTKSASVHVLRSPARSYVHRVYDRYRRCGVRSDKPQPLPA